MTQFAYFFTKKYYFTLICMSFLLAICHTSNAQINVNPSQTAAALAQMLVGPGVQIANPTLTCPAIANGKYQVVSTPNPIGIDSGVLLTSGRAQTAAAAIGVNGAYALFASNDNFAAGDPDLTILSGQTTHDACVLQFDFSPAGDTIKFDYVFGSEEYNGPHGNYNCSINDVFAFFISGPGITGQKNIALIPGTTIPVGVSTVNDGVGAAPGNSCYINTNGNGPYTQYYINNAGSTIWTYTGHTVVFTAISAVTPCVSYHLKLAIADASDGVWDSGVFLKAGSLTSNAITIAPVGGGGLSSPVPYCVRGCLPGQFIFTRPAAKPTPLTIHYQIVGNAVNGTDYTTIPDSVIIPANGTSVIRQIFGLPLPPSGPKTVKLRVLSPYSCGVNTPIIDSAQLVIYDSFQVQILTPDTAVCQGQPVNIRVQGENILSYSWSPTTGLNNPNIKEPIATPNLNTTYTLSANLPGSGCIPTTKQLIVTVKIPPTINLGVDTTTCIGTPYQINPTITPPATVQSYTYTWTPATNLSSGSILNPLFTPTTVGTQMYILTADPGTYNCSRSDTINIRTLPGDFNLFNHDTAICIGSTVQINASGDPAFTYMWTPVIGVSNPNILTPGITPDTARTYTIKASFPGCPDIVKTLKIELQPNPIAYAGPDRAKCQWDTLQLHGTVTPPYPNYIYQWSSHPRIDDPTKADIVFAGEHDTTLTFIVKTPAGCIDSDHVTITVHSGNFASVSPLDTGVCPRSTVPIIVTGGVGYHWSPSLFLDDSTSATPISSPAASVKYTGLITDQYGCKDTVYTNIILYPEAVLDLGDSVIIYPGENMQMNAQGNCSYFTWFPPLGLSNPNIGNPVAMPDVNTKYIVTGKTENGCVTTDTIVVMVSPESLLDMPNAFSPGSAPNDILKINKRGIASLKYFRIFNRWGTKVFETSNIDEGWDGRLNGSPQPMGVYVYTIEAYTNTGKKFIKQGNVTLIR